MRRTISAPTEKGKTMSDREKLIELIKQARRNAWGKSLSKIGSEEEFIADHLLANGVIVPPCNVGDTIYRCGDPIKKAYEWDIEHIEIYYDEMVFVDDSDNEFTEADIGKTVFLTREDAEAALKEAQA